MTLNRKLLFFDTIDSTHNYAIHHARLFDPSVLTCIRAYEQTQGQGQRDRSWISLKGNLLISYVVKIPSQVYPESANFLALILYQVLHKAGRDVYFKAPNDLYFVGKKCAGFLCHQAEDRLVLSYGLNTKYAPEGFTALDLDTENIFLQIDTAIFESLPLFLIEGFCPFFEEWAQVKRY